MVVVLITFTYCTKLIMLNQSYFHTMKFNLRDYDLGYSGLGDFSLGDFSLGF